MLDFREIKQIRITDVLGRYHVALKFKGQWATCIALGQSVCGQPNRTISGAAVSST